MPKNKQQAWHAPKFDKVLCGTMSDRERLGLPDYYVEDRFSRNYQAIYERMRFLGKDALIKLCEHKDVLLLERMVAGNLLAISGDPRINTFAPQIVNIPGGDIEIGLAYEEVDSVLIKYNGLGLDRKWIEKECPRHTVKIKSYAIAKYPVTNQEYRDFLLESKYPELPSSWDYRKFPLEHSNHPVYSISEHAADDYCQWLSKKTGRAFRLPSEAEWEYAAGGPEGYEFPWGNDFKADFANTLETGLFESTPVGIFVEGNSPFGIADMAGNVEEYVADNYKAYAGGEFITDHLVEIQGTYRLARGGSFARFRDLARTRRRHGQNTRSVVYAMGFRLAEDI